MNSGHLSASTRLLPASARAFAPTAHEVPPLARISFVKNVGQYEALAGQTERALKTLGLARIAAEEQLLQGQLRQIDVLAELIEAGEQPVLATYRAA